MLYTNEAIQKRQKRERIFRKIITIIAYIIIIPLIIYNISLIVQSIMNPNKTPDFFGIKTYVIISGSMEPNLNIGDIVIAKETNEIQENDIICFRQGQGVVTHRVAEKTEIEGKVEYKTKGDNNNVEDSGTITDSVIEGKVIGKIPYAGNITMLLQKKAIIVLLIIALYVYLIFTNGRKRKKEERKQKRLMHENQNKKSSQ